VKIAFLSGEAHLVLDPTSERASGGAELQVALLAGELVRLGHEVEIIGANIGAPDGMSRQGVRLREGGRFDTGSLFAAPAALLKIARVLRRSRPDWVVVYGWTSWLAVLVVLRAFIPFKLAFVCALDAEIDGVFRRENPLRGFLFDLGMRGADARLSITEHQRQLFLAAGMSCSLTRLLLQHPAPDEVPPKSIDLLWVARCQPEKGPHRFLDLAERLPATRCRMICSAQDRALWETVHARARTLPNVEFLERVPYREIQSHFDAARLFVNTSDKEGVPNTFLHAAIGATPILSLSVNPDGLFDRFAAGFCARGDFFALVLECERFLADPAAIARAGNEGRRFLGEWHDNGRNAGSFLQGLSA